jgi:hypothetical protein
MCEGIREIKDPTLPSKGIFTQHEEIHQQRLLKPNIRELDFPPLLLLFSFASILFN